MRISGLALQHFRTYSNRTLLFPKPLTVILAPNATGKTNLLEAIHLVATGESFRAGKVEDFIQIHQEFGRIKVKAEKLSGAAIDNLDTLLNPDSPTPESFELELLLNRGLVSGKRVAKKIFSLNGIKKQRRSITGILPCIAFIPEDLRLITGSPSRRREFLNTVLMQIDQNYLTSLTQYEQTLRRRNKLLQQIREGEAPRTVLSFWDQSLIKHGSYMQRQRSWFIDHLNQIKFPLQFQVEYDSSIVSEARLKQYEREEVFAGHTLVGPHKDDIVVKFSIADNSAKAKAPLSDRYPLHTHGSRGQQRMGVLWMKLGSFELVKQKTGLRPILLLDDIFSELDKENRQRVLEIAKTTQTIMTSAEEDILALPDLAEADIIRL